MEDSAICENNDYFSLNTNSKDAITYHHGYQYSNPKLYASPSQNVEEILAPNPLTSFSMTQIGNICDPISSGIESRSIMSIDCTVCGKRDK